VHLNPLKEQPQAVNFYCEFAMIDPTGYILVRAASIEADP
jgi:hypothetical protein